jgi:hypothetical protein
MQLKYGSYPFLSGGCDIRARLRTNLNKAGQPYSTRQSCDVSGFLQGSGQADITAQMNALASALAIPYQDLIFYRDDGGASATGLLNAPSLSGVIITRGPEFLTNQGGEYSTYRKFEFTAEAEYPLAGSQGLLLSFTESLRFRGGLAKRTIMLAVSGPHQAQTIYPTTPYEVVQQGEAVGYRSYPVTPGPIWPSALIESPDNELVTPERQPKGYQGYKTTWSYRFMSLKPLRGSPTLWTG